MPIPSFRTVREVTLIALRHILLPINAIIFAVVVLLIVFGETREGLFLGSIVLLNIILGFGQDVRAWLLLERLQLLTIPKARRLTSDGREEEIPLEELTKGDRIALKLGDQIPCDGVMLSSNSLEVNEGLITGESDSFAKGEGATVLAGSVVTSGMGTMRVDTSFAESRMAKMARGLKRYSANPSPIQESIETIIRYTVAVLVAVALFIIGRGIITHEATVHIVEQIGALASVLVPQGLVVSTTLLFTYGAGHFYNRHVLLQEVNATEKFGRVKNLCMDKTGTLTENELTVKRLEVPAGGSEAETKEFAALYVRHSGDSSQTIRALANFLPPAPERPIRDTLSFSSWRHYGGIVFAHEADGGADTAVFLGGPEVFSPHVKKDHERTWLAERTAEAAREGNRVLCIARVRASQVPHELSGNTLSVAGLFVLDNKLREGVQNAVNFFQDRGVTIRILSGDHPDTVRTIASRAGVKNTSAVITGAEMKGWSVEDYEKKAHDYALFTRIEPEQKEKLIEAFKKDGFTAMIGDGANDALSVKKADLGIALYDGAPATRQIAAVVLMRNSFIELPAGVRLADSMIENIEIFSAIFMNQTFNQFFFFILLALVGLAFPLAPLHITFINYFTVGFSGLLISFWAINPPERTTPASMRPFLARVLPFPLALSVVQTLAMIAIMIAGSRIIPGVQVAPLLTIGIIVFSLAFLALASEFYSGGLIRARRLALAAFVAIEAVMLYAAFQIPIVLTFFTIPLPSLTGTEIALAIAIIASILQYAVAKSFFANRYATVRP